MSLWQPGKNTSFSTRAEHMQWCDGKQRGKIIFSRDAEKQILLYASFRPVFCDHMITRRVFVSHRLSSLLFISILLITFSPSYLFYSFSYD